MFIFGYLAFLLISSSLVVYTSDGSIENFIYAFNQASMEAGYLYGHATLTISSTLASIKLTTQPIIVNALQTLLAAASPYTTTPIETYETVINTEQLLVKDWNLLVICGVGAVFAFVFTSIGFTINYKILTKRFRK